MPSLTDIPEHLHPIAMKEQFVRWLCLQPIPDNARRTLVSFWCAENMTRFTPADWQIIKSTAIKIN